MSDVRKPDITILVRHKSSKSIKIELFKEEQFREPKLNEAYRMRKNGSWFPKGKKEFYKLEGFAHWLYYGDILSPVKPIK